MARTVDQVVVLQGVTATKTQLVRVVHAHARRELRLVDMIRRCIEAVGIARQLVIAIAIAINIHATNMIPSHTAMPTGVSTSRSPTVTTTAIASVTMTTSRAPVPTPNLHAPLPTGILTSRIPSIAPLPSGVITEGRPTITTVVASVTMTTSKIALLWGLTKVKPKSTSTCPKSAAAKPIPTANARGRLTAKGVTPKAITATVVDGRLAAEGVPAK